MRGADVGSRERILALTAFCFGLFYDKDALAAAGDAGARLDRRGSAAPARRRPAARPQGADRRATAGRSRARGGGDRRAAGWRAGRGATPPDATRLSISRRWSASPPKGAPLRTCGSSDSMGPGGGRSTRFSAKRRSELATELPQPTTIAARGRSDGGNSCSVHPHFGTQAPPLQMRSLSNQGLNECLRNC